jgi:hypothetical protein
MLLRSSPLSAAFAFAAFASAGCGSAEYTPWPLGPVPPPKTTGDAASVSDAPSPPAPATLRTTECTTPPVRGAGIASTVRAIAALDERAIVTLDSGVDAYQLDPSGCPGPKIASFGQGGHVGIQAHAAVPLAGGRVLVAGPAGVVLLGPTGEPSGTCSGTGTQAPRILDAARDGTGWAAFSRAPIARLSTPLATPTSCASASMALSPSPFLLVALAHALDDAGFVMAEQSAPSAQLGVSRYDASGKRVATLAGAAPGHPAHLCAASGIADTPAGIAIADGACSRVVLLRAADFVAAGEARFDGSPRGLAAIHDGADLLTAIARSTEDGAEARFVVVKLTL